MGDVRYEIRRGKLTTVELICQHWDEPIEMQATDISPGGLFLPSDILLEAGEPVVACFHMLGHKQEFQLFGDIVWIAAPRRASDHGVAGMGIEFVKTSPMERLAIRHSLRGVPPPLPYRFSGTHGAVPTA